MNPEKTREYSEAEIKMLTRSERVKSNLYSFDKLEPTNWNRKAYNCRSNWETIWYQQFSFN